MLSINGCCFVKIFPWNSVDCCSQRMGVAWSKPPLGAMTGVLHTCFQTLGVPKHTPKDAPGKNKHGLNMNIEHMCKTCLDISGKPHRTNTCVLNPVVCLLKMNPALEETWEYPTLEPTGAGAWVADCFMTFNFARFRHEAINSTRKEGELLPC